MQVLSSLSGIPFYAPSAGFSPTNSADVSAIASSYQVVSATATQLYAGTAYVTSVNDNPLSASRAGNATNASMANSAYYDGTGRLISALPDSAAVSGIASAYAESAASGKLDKTAQVVTSIGTGWNSDDDEIVSAVNGCLLSADEARYAGAADWANYARYDRRPNVTGYRSISSLPGSAEVSAIASSYAESAASSKQDTLTYGYNAANQISSIDGSALGGMDEAAVSGIASAYAESAVSSVSGNYYTTANESGFLTAQAQASWSESASASPSYIQDKPDLVDIVAGPGIVVDNPDGNTLRVSQAYPTDETVLYNNSAAVASCTLSETIFNFERIKVYSLNGINSLAAMEFECSGSGYLNCMIAGGNNQPVYRIIQITVDSIGTSLVANRSVGIFFNAFSGTPTYRFSSSADLMCINKIVGIHRIAGGN